LIKSENRTNTWIEDAIALSDEKFIKAIIDGALPQSIRKRKMSKDSGSNTETSKVKT
jgi:hypothetical protein